MSQKFHLEDKVIGRTVERLNHKGIVKDVSPPQTGQRGYKYIVRWDDAVKSFEAEKDLWECHEEDPSDDDSSVPESMGSSESSRAESVPLEGSNTVGNCAGVANAGEEEGMDLVNHFGGHLERDNVGRGNGGRGRGGRGRGGRGGVW